MIRKSFLWEEDRTLGGYGWIPEGMPGFNASKGLGVAHDTLEHFANDTGDLTAECQAFGAMLYIRGEGGYFSQIGTYNPNPAYHMGSDLGRFVIESLMEGISDYDAYIKPPPLTYKLNPDTEELLTEIKEEALKQAILFLNGIANPDEQDISRADIIQKLDEINSWMRRGYRRAVLRYHKASAVELAYLFSTLEAKVDKFYTQGDVGDRLVVKVNPTTLQFAVEQNIIYDIY
ncbi:MAG: hypothetical protein ACYC3W_10900 [Candidatus Nanopelagicales bacterium]